MDRADESAGPAGPGGLSLPARVVVAAGAWLTGAVAAVHLGMVFFHVAPPNVVSREHDDVIDAWIHPELDQNWKLFAPEPLHQTVRVHARARVREDDGTLTTTGWYDLSAQDIAATRGHPLPSHTRHHLRKGWGVFSDSHDERHRPVGPRGYLMRAYLERIALERLADLTHHADIEQFQLRSAATPVPAPPWEADRSATTTRYDELPWWPVAGADLPEGSRP
ncbi:DUF5819 family protein [Streptomyces sp. TRM 70351]|uniref:DUF5819 family protein n=1 Tax=Streptomyces sp. TRM 70351 TaxID=3116552 RepID=UPI002E7C2266|nr:DUF5819 family protein [Streptomyces sp. TRM 70351]MEE1927056.1 DUF5819 family protein [Streptomyces sp. TRM 70351]